MCDEPYRHPSVRQVSPVLLSPQTSMTWMVRGCYIVPNVRWTVSTSVCQTGFLSAPFPTDIGMTWMVRGCYNQLSSLLQKYVNFWKKSSSVHLPIEQILRKHSYWRILSSWQDLASSTNLCPQIFFYLVKVQQLFVWGSHFSFLLTEAPPCFLLSVSVCVYTLVALWRRLY